MIPGEVDIKIGDVVIIKKENSPEQIATVTKISRSKKGHSYLTLKLRDHEEDLLPDASEPCEA